MERKRLGQWDVNRSGLIVRLPKELQKEKLSHATKRTKLERGKQGEAASTEIWVLGEAKAHDSRICRAHPSWREPFQPTCVGVLLYTPTTWCGLHGFFLHQDGGAWLTLVQGYTILAL